MMAMKEADEVSERTDGLGRPPVAGVVQCRTLLLKVGCGDQQQGITLKEVRALSPETYQIRPLVLEDPRRPCVYEWARRPPGSMVSKVTHWSLRPAS